jgi:hypothetical protein
MLGGKEHVHVGANAMFEQLSDFIQEALPLSLTWPGFDGYDFRSDER